MQENNDLWKEVFIATFERVERIISRVDIGCTDEFDDLSRKELLDVAVDQQIVLEKIATLIDGTIPQTIEAIEFEEWKQHLLKGPVK